MIRIYPFSKAAAVGLFGLALIAAAFVRLPCYPVSFTLQTLVVMLAGLHLTPSEAALSALLGWGSGIGFGRGLGYTLSLPIAAFLIAHLRERIPALYALALGQLLIYSCGVLWLSQYVGFSAAFWKGGALFLPSALLKNILARQLCKR